MLGTRARRDSLVSGFGSTDPRQPSASNGSWWALAVFRKARPSPIRTSAALSPRLTVASRRSFRSPARGNRNDWTFHALALLGRLSSHHDQDRNTCSSSSVVSAARDVVGAIAGLRPDRRACA